MPFAAEDQITLESLTGYSSSARRAPGISGNTPFMGMAEHSLAEYASLSAAKTAIGTSTKTTLTISEPVTLASGTVDFSDTQIFLKFVNDGMITVNSGATLITKGIEAAGNRQIFAGAGTIRYANGSVNLVNTAWRAGNANGANVTAAIEEAIASFAIYGGICAIYCPQLSPVTDGGHELNSSTIIFGNGNYATGGNGYGTSLTLASGTSESYMFKIGQAKYGIRFRDIILSANAQNTKDLVLFEGAEGGGQSTADVSFTNVTFYGGRYGVNMNSTSGSWQVTQVAFFQSIFQGCATAGIRTNSVNQEFVCFNTNFSIPSGALGHKNEGSGMVDFIHCQAGGGGTTSKFAVMSAAHGMVNFYSCRSENCGTWTQHDTNSLDNVTNNYNCIIQGKIQINQTCVINIQGGSVMSLVLQGAGDGYGSILPSAIREVSALDGVTVVSPAVLSGLTGNFTVVTENIPELNVFKQRLPQVFTSQLDGAPTVHNVTAGYYTPGGQDKRLLYIGSLTSAGAIFSGYSFGFKYSTESLELIPLTSGSNPSLLNFNGVHKSKTLEYIVIPLSDESTDLTTGTAKVTLRMKGAFRLTAVRAEVNTAPTGSTLIVDINVAGSTILSTKLSIDASEKTSVTAASAAVIDGSGSETELTIADDAELTFDIDQIGSTIAGKGLKVTLIGFRYGV